MSKTKKKCLTCGNIFYTYRNKFCSKECYKSKIKKICPVCGIEYSIYRSQVTKGEGNFCSKKCYIKKIERVCDRCGKTFYVWRSTLKQRKSIFCSNICRRKNGISLSYGGLHVWRQYNVGKASCCEICGKDSSIRKITWANLSHKYTKDPSDWKQMCYSCHKLYDLKFLKDNPKTKPLKLTLKAPRKPSALKVAMA